MMVSIAICAQWSDDVHTATTSLQRMTWVRARRSRCNTSHWPSSLAQRSYCNPMNLDYGFTPIPNFSEWGRHRATADPVIVTYKNEYYLFSTNPSLVISSAGSSTGTEYTYSWTTSNGLIISDPLLTNITVGAAGAFFFYN